MVKYLAPVTVAIVLDVVKVWVNSFRVFTANNQVAEGKGKLKFYCRKTKLRKESNVVGMFEIFIFL